MESLRGFSIKNHKKACLYFWPEFNGVAKPGYVLHHKDSSLKYKDPKRYHEWRPDDLIPMTRSEHMKIHHPDAIKYFDNKKQSESLKKYWQTHTHPMFGKHLSGDTKTKISKAHIGKHLSEETKAKISASNKGLTRPSRDLQWSERQREARLGLHYWNNGSINKMVKTCPGEGWVKGRIKIQRQS